MKPSALFIINSDPRSSSRPAEGIRIAAGIGVWKQVAVTVSLCGAAVLIIGDCVEGLVDEENFTRYLPILGGLGRPVYVQTDAPLLKEIGPPTLPIESLTLPKLAELAAASTYVIRF